jgi:hypothetical protein
MFFLAAHKLASEAALTFVAPKAKTRAAAMMIEAKMRTIKFLLTEMWDLSVNGIDQRNYSSIEVAGSS